MAKSLMSEAELQDAVIELARLLNYRVAHFRSALTGKGWRTPVSADGKGFPDLVCVHPVGRRVIFAELKSDSGRLTVEQRAWTDCLFRAGAESYVWCPDDWLSGRVERVLRGRAEGKAA